MSETLHPTLSNQDLARSVIDNLNRAFGIDLDTILLDPALTPVQKHRRAAAELIEAAAKSHSDGPEGNGPDEDPFDLPAAVLGLRSGSDDVVLQPNLYVPLHNALLVADYQGRDVTDWVHRLTVGLSSLTEESTAAQIGKQLMGAGISAITLKFAKEVVKGLIIFSDLRRAVNAAVGALGTKFVLFNCGIFLIGLVLWLLFVEKNMTGLIVNNTDSDYVVKGWKKSIGSYGGGQLYMAHGEMKAFPDELSGPYLDSEHVQLTARDLVPGHMDDSQIAVGLYFADRHAGLRGAEGLLILTEVGGGGVAWAHQFACPYQHSNRTNIEKLDATDLPADKDQMEKLFRRLYNADKVRVKHSYAGPDGDYSVTSTVDSASGGDPKLICTINQPV